MKHRLLFHIKFTSVLALNQRVTALTYLKEIEPARFDLNLADTLERERFFFLVYRITIVLILPLQH